MKKLLSLILTLALLSTMFVFGGASASAAAATVTETNLPLTVDTIYIKEVGTIATDATTDTETGEEIPATNKNVTGYEVTHIDPNNASSAYNSIVYGSAKYKLGGWMLYKVDLKDLIEVSAADFTFSVGGIKNSYLKLYLYAIDYETGSQVADIVTVGETKTLKASEKPALVTPGSITKSQLYYFRSTNNVTGNGERSLNQTISSSIADIAGNTSTTVANNVPAKSGSKLLKHIQDAVANHQEYVYFMAHYDLGDVSKKYSANAYNSASDTYAPSCVIAGTKAIGGIGTKIIAEKTATVKATASYHQKYRPEYTTTDSSTGEVTTHNELNQIIYNENGYETVRAGQTPAGTYWNTYLSFDISELVDKELDSAKLKFELYRSGGVGNNMIGSVKIQRVSDLDTTFGALELAQGSNTLESKPTEPTLVGDVTEMSASTTSVTTTCNLKSIVEEAIAAGETTVDIRVYNYRTHAENQTNGLRLYQAGHSSYAPSITFTYLEELDTAAEETIAPNTTFTFKGEINDANVSVRLVVALYAGDTFLGAVVTPDTAARELDVDLSAYPTATKVKCYFWNGDTLVPFMGVTEADIAAAA